MPTAAVVVIGEEILSGKFADDNGPYLIRRLRELGCDLRHIAVIGDTVDAIADEVRRQTAANDHVITTGGVGPTQDDRTFDGIAAAFGVGLEEQPALVALLRKWNVPASPANLRMARPPAGATLIPGSSYPVVRVRNVWVFPGVPRLMREKFESVSAHFAGPAVLTHRLYLSQRETEIADDLAVLQTAHPAVAIGSYPRGGEERYRVVLTLESRDADALAAAERALTARLSPVDPAG